MKILESYKKIAKSMLIEHAWDRKFGEPLPTLEDVMREAEVDDDTEIKFKVTDKDGKPTGETDSMPASSAKKMEKTHPAKIEYDRLAKKGGEDKPEEPSGKLSGGDFTRKSFTGPQGDEPEGMYGDDEDDRAPGEPEWDDEEMSGDEIRRLAKLVSKSKGDDEPDEPEVDTKKPSGDGDWHPIMIKNIAGSIADDEDAIEAAQQLAQGEGTLTAYRALEKAGHLQLAQAIFHSKHDEDKFELVKRASDDAQKQKGTTDIEPIENSKSLQRLAAKIEDKTNVPKGSFELQGKTTADDGTSIIQWKDKTDGMLMGVDGEGNVYEDGKKTSYKASSAFDDEEGGKEESISINGQKYRPIKESVEPKKHPLRETYERIGGK